MRRDRKTGKKAGIGKRYRMRRRILAVTTVFGIAAAGLLVGGGLRSHQAQASSAYHTQTYYESIEISRGDTLWEIADRYMGEDYADKASYIAAVKRINHMTGDTIQTGSYLIVPCSKSVE